VLDSKISKRSVPGMGIAINNLGTRSESREFCWPVRDAAVDLFFARAVLQFAMQRPSHALYDLQVPEYC
jgi:hypothetical protein